jgi:hypothetical protein
MAKTSQIRPTPAAIVANQKKYPTWFSYPDLRIRVMAIPGLHQLNVE